MPLVPEGATVLNKNILVLSSFLTEISLKVFVIVLYLNIGIPVVLCISQCSRDRPIPGIYTDTNILGESRVTVTLDVTLHLPELIYHHNLQE